MAKNWQKSGICGKFFFLQNLHFLTNEKWHFWRQNPLEPKLARGACAPLFYVY